MNFLSVLYAKAGITVDGVTTLNNTATGLTPATNDNSTKLATTGFVKNQNYYPYPTGTTAQYVRGDGSLATFTQTGGGGSSVSYYLNGSVSQGTIGGNTYYEMSKTAIIGTNADFNLNADGYIAQFVTDAGDPALLSIPGGNWNFEMFFSASSGGGSPSFYVELYKYDGTTLTLIASGSAVPESITGGTSIDLYVTALAVPTTTLTLTDRLAVRVYVTHSGRTITLHTQNGHLCQIITTFTTGLTALNGLTAQVQNFAVGAGGSDFNISSVTDTHTFNLPTASATKRGALSSIDWSAFDAKVDFGDLSATSPLSYNGSGVFTIAQSSTSTNGYLSSTDWNTFNNKQNALTNPVTGTGTANYIARFNGTTTIENSIIYDNGTNVGIGTTSPTYKLEVNGDALIRNAYIGNISAFGTNYASFSHISRTGTGDYSFLSGSVGETYINAKASNIIYFRIDNQDKVILASSGNLLIGTSTDAGYKLYVNGSGRFSTMVDIITANGNVLTFGLSGQPSITLFQNATTYAFYNNTTLQIDFSINNTTGAAIFRSSVTATNFIVPGGTSAQFLKADGSLDSSVYLTSTSSTFSYTASVTLSPTWQNTGVSSVNLGTGAYLVTCNADDFGVGGGQYNCTYTGLMYFFAGATNGSNANEIVLHHTGHADNGRYIYLRTLNTVSADGKTYLQISGNGTNSAASNYQLTFKKLL